MNPIPELTPNASTKTAANMIVPPWYKDVYCWLVLSFPIAAIVSCAITTVLAVRSFDGLVVDDYYKQGLAVNRVLSRDAEAIVRGLSADLHWDRSAQRLTIKMKANAQFVFPQLLNLDIIFATRADHDRHVVAQRVSNDAYEVTVPGLAAGHWYIHITQDNWRINNSLYLSE